MSDAAQEPTVPPGYSAVTPGSSSPDSAALVRFLEVAAEVAGSRMLNQERSGSESHRPRDRAGNRAGCVRDLFGKIWWLQSHACGVRKPVRHAAAAYSWMSPPRRSRLWT